MKNKYTEFFRQLLNATAEDRREMIDALAIVAVESAIKERRDQPLHVDLFATYPAITSVCRQIGVDIHQFTMSRDINNGYVLKINGLDAYARSQAIERLDALIQGEPINVPEPKSISLLDALREVVAALPTLEEDRIKKHRDCVVNYHLGWYHVPKMPLAKIVESDDYLKAIESERFSYHLKAIESKHPTHQSESATINTEFELRPNKEVNTKLKKYEPLPRSEYDNYLGHAEVHGEAADMYFCRATDIAEPTVILVREDPEHSTVITKKSILEASTDRLFTLARERAIYLGLAFSASGSPKIRQWEPLNEMQKRMWPGTVYLGNHDNADMYFLPGCEPVGPSILIKRHETINRFLVPDHKILAHSGNQITTVTPSNKEPALLTAIYAAEQRGFITRIDVMRLKKQWACILDSDSRPTCHLRESK